MAKSNNNLFLDPHKDFVFNSANWEYQYLYITSDEEIREGDYYIDDLVHPRLVTHPLQHSGHVYSSNIIQSNSGTTSPISTSKKIILTTNQDLIADGVQEIDNEFLKWFIKNSTREFVHVEKGFSDGTDYGFNFIDYQIILPKKCDCTNFCRRGTFDDWIMYCDDDANEKQLDTLPEFELKKDIFDTLSSLLEPGEAHAYRYSGKKTSPVKCYDKFNQLLKEGDYVDVQRDGVHQIYKKDDGELYFAPYGEEDMVSAYFSNDIAKCNKDGYWINNDRYEDIVIEPAQSPIGGFAPGSYWCNCVTCKDKFMGDKRAVQCEPCAIEMVNIKVNINEQGGIEAVKEEAKQETLKDVAINYSSYNEQINKAVQEAVIFGAEWQAKRMYSEEDMIEFNEWVSLNFPNQHNYLRALQKRNQGLDVPKEHLVGYCSTKELFDKFKKK